MIDKVVVNQSKTQATIYFTGREPFTLSHSEGRVLDLLVQFLLPIGSINPDVTWNGLLSSHEDTAVVDVSKLNVA